MLKQLEKTSSRSANTRKGHGDIERADPYSFQVAHRRLAWVFRASVVVNVCLAFIVVSLSATITTLVPLRETRIALIKADPADDRLYQVKPVMQYTDGFRLAMESAARNFVRSLLEIDVTTQKVRWDHARQLSEAKFWNGWLDSHAGRVNDAIKDGLTRQIFIETSDQLEQRQHEWLIAVDFSQTDRFYDEISEEKSLRAYVRLVTRPQRVSEEQRFENPLGITVLDVTVKHRGPVAQETNQT